jgi:hypothetical protein
MLYGLIADCRFEQRMADRKIHTLIEGPALFETPSQRIDASRSVITMSMLAYGLGLKIRSKNVQSSKGY